MTDDLRSALAAGDTPAGVDVTAVRARARRLRRRRAALTAAAAAAVTALAVAVPVGLLRTDPAPAASSRPELACADRVPDPPRNTGPGLAEALVPFSPEEGLICSYDAPPDGSGPLTGVARTTAAELRSALDQIDSRIGPDSPSLCTSEFGFPFAVQVAGAGRVVTLRLEPYGCGTVTNGTRAVYAAEHKDLMLALSVQARTSSQCPQRLGVPPAVPSGGEAPGQSILPEDARRLLICRYSPSGAGEKAGKAFWNAALDAEDTRRVVADLNASPPLELGPGAGCPRDAGPLLVLFAVTPDGVVPVVADAGGCGVVDNGVRKVVAKGLVRQLATLS